MGSTAKAKVALAKVYSWPQQTDVTLTCMDALGGVSVTLTGGTLEQEQMAQVRFELLASDGQTTDLALTDGAFYAGQLAAGTYVLRQTQMPEGYTLSGEQTVTVAGGEVQRVRVLLEEYALLSVSKTGLTFNDKLQTYVVPLTGEYGVYTMENGSLCAGHCAVLDGCDGARGRSQRS